jgi:flagellin
MNRKEIIMTISSVSNTGYSSYTNYTGSSAAESPAQVGIDERQTAQANGYSVGSVNITSAQSMLNVADGAMSGITDYLQSIRELAVQASNDLLSDSDKQHIQDQIEQYKQGITDITANTSYNTKNLLDGSNENFQIATDGNGNATEVTTSNTTLESLGIADFDVTGDFDLSVIDQAIEHVSTSRASSGAQSNALSYAQDYADYNASTLKAQADDEKLNALIEEAQKRKREQALESYRIQMQKNKIRDAQTATTNLFS